MSAPRLWTTLPAQHHRHGKMEELLERHGASGPHAFTVLLAEAAAMLQGRDSRGVVEMSWRDFARFGGIKRDAVQGRLRELTEEPFTLIEIERLTELGFRARILRWGEWDRMPKDPTATERKRKQRDRERDEP
jgi:hypothetical protein